MRGEMSENLDLEQAARVLTDDFGMTRVEVGKTLLLAEVFTDIRIDLPHRTTLTVSFRQGKFMTKGGDIVLHEVESLDEQALQEQAQAVQLELFPENPPEDSWEPSPPEALRVFEEYDDLTGEFDE